MARSFTHFVLFLSLLFPLVSSAQGELPPAGIYRIVSEESKIQIKAGTGGLFGFVGHDHLIVPKTFTGEMEFKPQDPNPATLSIKIDATGLYEAAEFDQKDKEKIEKQMHEEVLETTKYPEITFQSTKVSYSKSPGHIFDARIEGDMTLHGVNRKVTVPARITEDQGVLRATGKFEIKRKDYNIETKSAGGGTVKVSNDLEITFDIVMKTEATPQTAPQE